MAPRLSEFFFQLFFLNDLHNIEWISTTKKREKNSIKQKNSENENDKILLYLTTTNEEKKYTVNSNETKIRHTELIFAWQNTHTANANTNTN